MRKANRIVRQFIASNYAAQVAQAAVPMPSGMGIFTPARLSRRQAQRLIHKGERADWII